VKKNQFRKIFLLWIWATFFIPMLVWPSAKANGLDTIETYLRSVGEIEKNPSLDAHQAAREIYELATKVNEIARQSRREFFAKFGPIRGLEEFKALVDKNGITVTESYGKAEVSNVNGSEAIKIRHRSTDFSIIFMDLKRTDKSSTHYISFIARQLIDAGVSRTEKSRDRDRLGGEGRDVLEIDFESSSTSSEIQILDEPSIILRPDRLTPERAKVVWQASYKNPTPGDNQLATYCMVVQAGLACGIAFYKLHAGLTHEFLWQAAALSAIFGGVIGRYVSLYRNIKTRGPLWWQTAKSSGISLLYALLLDAWTGHPINAPYLLTNVTENNLAKVQFEDRATIRSNKRLNQKKLKIFGYETAINQASFEAQNLYLFPFSFRLAGLLGIPGSDVILIASIPLVQWLNLRYAEKIGSELYEVRRLAWERNPLGLVTRLTLGTAFHIFAANFHELRSMITGADSKAEEHLYQAAEYWSRAMYAPSYYAGSIANGTSMILAGKPFGKKVPSLAEIGDKLLFGNVSKCAVALSALGMKLQTKYELAIQSGLHE
jgi:hypothetical protein